MGEDYLTRIANAMESKKYGAQEFIVTQDEEGSSLFIVEEGLVNILVNDTAGTNQWVAHIPARRVLWGNGPIGRRAPGSLRSGGNRAHLL